MKMMKKGRPRVSRTRSIRSDTAFKVHPGGLHLAVLVLAALMLEGAVFAATSPVSPGHAERFPKINESCPSFSWTAVSEAQGYELVVYAASEGATPIAVMNRTLPAGATSWTPSAEQCLSPGRRYAWSVRAVDAVGAGDWSEASLFEVSRGPSQAELRAALEVVRRHLALGASAGILDERYGEADGTVLGGASDERAAPASPDAPAPAAATVLAQASL